jgi:hypothetical protein
MTVNHLSQSELATRWRMSMRTLERWRWLGEGPCFIKLGGRVVYRLADIEAFEAAKLRDSTSQTQPPVPDYRNERSVPVSPANQTPQPIRKRGAP